MTVRDAPNPVLRSFDEAKARAFYFGFLGFEGVFEHRFARPVIADETWGRDMTVIDPSGNRIIYSARKV